MKSRILPGFLIFFVLFLMCFLPSFAYYNFLSPECNIYLEELKEKFREKEIILEKEEGVVWVVILPKNSGVITKEVKEEIEGRIYTITEITIMNARGETRIVWGSAAETYSHDIPKLRFVFDS